MAFAAALKRWRRRKFLTQQGLADALGMALSTVQRWEMGYGLPRPSTQRQLIEVLGLTAEEFFAALEGEQQGQGGKAAA
jgi:transcriptional regulator with XRE-family HTH domain